MATVRTVTDDGAGESKWVKSRAVEMVMLVMTAMIFAEHDIRGTLK